MKALGPSMVGHRYGRLTVIRAIGRMVECVCDCGGTRVSRASSVRLGATISCGCAMRDEYHKRRIVPGGTRRYPEHQIWRGITVCDEWREDFNAFLAHIGRRPSPSHSLDRINNDGNYEPGNVRWATKREQGLNRRKKTRCKRGHDLTLPNAMKRRPGGAPRCRICAIIDGRAYRQRRRKDAKAEGRT